jgi:hypothetical protein
MTVSGPLSRRPAILAIAGMSFVSCVAQAAFPSGLTQLATLLMVVPYLGATLLAMFVLARSWRAPNWRSAIPLACCLAVLPAAVPAGDAARELRFALDLPTYEAIVARRDVQELAPGTRLDPLTLSDSESSGVYLAGAERMADGTLLVEIWNGSGWPVRHFGYLYTSSGTMPEGARVRERIFSHYQARPHWLRLVD